MAEERDAWRILKGVTKNSIISHGEMLHWHSNRVLSSRALSNEISQAWALQKLRLKWGCNGAKWIQYGRWKNSRLLRLSEGKKSIPFAFFQQWGKKVRFLSLFCSQSISCTPSYSNRVAVIYRIINSRLRANNVNKFKRLRERKQLLRHQCFAELLTFFDSHFPLFDMC